VVDSKTESRGLEVLLAARALRRSEASLVCGWVGIVDIAEAVDGIRDIDGREVRALIAATTATAEERQIEERAILGP
jgi:hypothetical protein